MSASADETTSVEPTVTTTAAESKVTFTSEQLKEIERIKEEVAKPLKDEAAKYRVEKKTALEAEMIKNGEAAKLAEQRLVELTELQAKSKIQEEKLSQIETERRNELLEKLPEDKRKNYETLDISTLGLIVKDFAALKPNGESLGNDRGSGQNGAIPAVKTQTELYELMQKNPVAYAEYMKQK